MTMMTLLFIQNKKKENYPNLVQKKLEFVTHCRTAKLKTAKGYKHMLNND